MKQKLEHTLQATITKPNEKIFKVVWELTKQGKSKATIKNIKKALYVLAKKCNLDQPEMVRGFIARLDRKNGYKRAFIELSLQKIIETANQAAEIAKEDDFYQ